MTIALSFFVCKHSLVCFEILILAINTDNLFSKISKIRLKFKIYFLYFQLSLTKAKRLAEHVKTIDFGKDITAKKTYIILDT